MKLSRLARKLSRSSVFFVFLGFVSGVLFCHSQLLVQDLASTSLSRTRPLRWYMPMNSVKVYVAVATVHKYLLTRAKTVYNTWGRKVENVTFFVGADCNTSHPDLAGMKFVKLAVPDEVYPPRQKMFAMLDYISTYHLHEFQWFIRADDDVYIHNRNLQETLYKLNPNEKLYLGAPGKGLTEDVKRLQLLSHERFCLGGTAVIMSRALLQAIHPHLHNCLKTILEHDAKVDSSQYWLDDDVELGRCISRTLGIQCTEILNFPNIFFHDYSKEISDPVFLWSRHEALSIHPLKQPMNMLRVHHFFSVLDYAETSIISSNLKEDLLQTCKAMRSSLLEEPMQTLFPLQLALDMCNGDVTCACLSANQPVNDYFKYHSGLLLPGKENTWLQHLTSSELSTGQVECYIPSNTMQTVTLNITDYLKYVSQALDSEMTSLNLLGGLTQYSWLTGIQVFFDAEMTSANTLLKKIGKTDVFFRFQFIIQVHTEVIVAEDKLQAANSLTTIVVVSEPNQSFTSFLSSNLEAFLSVKPLVKLLLVVLGGSSNAATVQEMIDTEDYMKLTVEVVSDRRALSWPTAVEIALSKLSANDVVFLSDVSVDIQLQFLDRCRRMVAGFPNRVYQPIPSNCPITTVGSKCSSGEAKLSLVCGLRRFVHSWLEKFKLHSHISKSTAVEPLLTVRESDRKCCEEFS